MARINIIGELDVKHEQDRRVYKREGLSPCLRANHEVKILVETRKRKLGNIHGFTGGNFAGNVYDKNNLCPAISTMSGGGNNLWVSTLKKQNVLADCQKVNGGSNFTSKIECTRET